MITDRLDEEFVWLAFDHSFEDFDVHAVAGYTEEQSALEVVDETPGFGVLPLLQQRLLNILAMTQDWTGTLVRHTSFTVSPPRLWAMKNEGTEKPVPRREDVVLRTDWDRRLVTLRISSRNSLPRSSNVCVDSFPSSFVLEP